MILQSLWTLINFVNLGLKTCYSLLTVASELCTLHLFSCIISVIASYVITRAVITTTIISVRMATVLLELYKYTINHNCLRPHMTYHYIVLFTVVQFLSVFPWSNVTRIVRGTRANNCTFHCSWWYLHMHGDCMRRFTSHWSVFEVHQCFIIFIGKSSLTTNYVGNIPCSQW